LIQFFEDKQQTSMLFNRLLFEGRSQNCRVLLPTLDFITFIQITYLPVSGLVRY